MGSTFAGLDPVLARVLTSAVSLVLLVGAYQKLRQWEIFRAALANYGLLPDALVAPTALSLPVLELIAGIALLADPFNPRRTVVIDSRQFVVELVATLIIATVTLTTLALFAQAWLLN